MESTENKYNVVAGTHYNPDTPTEVIRILEDSRRTGTRLRLHYGDVKTGRDWMDEWDVTGRVSRSMGPMKIPILISSSRAMGGGGILDGCIVRIRTAAGNRELYRHPLYNRPTFTIADDPATPDNPFAVLSDGSTHARFKTAARREFWLKKMGIFDAVVAA